MNNNQVKSKIIILDNNSEEIKNINDKNVIYL